MGRCRRFVILREGWPLDHILGTLASVRVLRAMHHRHDASWPVEIARTARLSRQGAWNGLERLVAMGLATPAVHGDVRAVPYRLVREHPLFECLRWAFIVEGGAMRSLGIPPGRDLGRILTGATPPLGARAFDEPPPRLDSPR